MVSFGAQLNRSLAQMLACLFVITELEGDILRCGAISVLLPVFGIANYEAALVGMSDEASIDVGVGIEAVPTIIVFKNAKPISKISGFMQKEYLISFINNSMKED